MTTCDDGGAIGRLYIDATNSLELTGLYDPDDPATPVISTAQVKVTGTDSDDVEITGVTWPITLAYDEEKDRYIGSIPADASLTENQRYTFTYTVIHAGQVSTFKTHRYAEFRTE